MRMPLVAILLAVLAVVVHPATVRAKARPCPGGRYLVGGAPLAGASVEPGIDVVDVAGRMVSVASGGCVATKARVRATARGTKIRAAWKSCGGLSGKALMNGMITEYCRTFTGTFTAKSAGIVTPFLAALSACGDGIWDPDGGEECDAGLGPCGGLCNACSCAGVTTTTVTGTTSPTTSVPGGSTTTTPTSPTTSSTAVGGTTSSTSPVPTTTSTSSASPTTTTSSSVPTTTSPVPTTTTTIFVIPTTSSSTTTVIATSTSTMPALPTTSTTSTTLAGPDLRPHAWMSPGSAPGGTNIFVEFTVRNFGNQTATGPWYDYIMMSGDYAFGGDVAIDVIERVANLSASSQYTVQRPQVFIPDVPPGTYYLYLQTDPTNAVAETNETNNVGGFVQLIVN